MSESNVENSESIFIENVREHYPRLAEKQILKKFRALRSPKQEKEFRI